MGSSVASTVDYPTNTTNTENLNTAPNMSDSFTSASSSLILDESRPSSNATANPSENSFTAPPQDPESLDASISRISSQSTLRPQDPPQDPGAVLAPEISIETAGVDDSTDAWNDNAIRTDTVVQPPNPRADGTTDQPPQRMPNAASSANANANTNSPPRSFLNGKLMPRDEDVVWCLEVLAFLSKYAYLRDQLQQTHLVPNLSTRGADDGLLNPESEHSDSCLRSREASAEPMDMDEEPCSGSSCHDHTSASDAKPDDHWDYENYDFESTQDIDDEFKGQLQNIFPLVEQFTTRQFTVEMKYWAGAIMRNSCRKDESKGGVRQCANFECGSWESFPRQFAKCRRCKRTKYCSKGCQLKAWNFHRHWCVPTSQSGSRSVTSTSSTNSQSFSAAPATPAAGNTAQSATVATQQHQPQRVARHPAQ